MEKFDDGFIPLREAGSLWFYIVITAAANGSEKRVLHSTSPLGMTNRV